MRPETDKKTPCSPSSVVWLSIYGIGTFSDDVMRKVGRELDLDERRLEPEDDGE